MIRWTETDLWVINDLKALCVLKNRYQNSHFIYNVAITNILANSGN